MKLKYSQNLQSFNLKGRVKMILDKTFIPSNTRDIETRATLIDTELVCFNNNGNLLKYRKQELFFNNYVLKKVYEYDNIGYCFKFKAIKYGKNKVNDVENSHINYDINNKTTEITVSKPDELNVSKTVLHFNNDGYLKECILHKNGKFTSRAYYRFGDNNKLIEKELYENDNYILTKYIPNNSGKTHKEAKYVNHIQKYEKKYKYDNDGNKTSIETIEFLYDDMPPKKNIEFDKFMNYLPNNKISRLKEFIYEYDNYGNWVKSTQVDDSMVTYITVRKIIYF